MVAQLLLVHSPLVGPATWELVAAQLAGHGYQVGVPDLTGTVTAGPPYWPRQAEVIARGVASQQVILIGHSGAGSLLPAAGSGIAQVEGYVFADAGLPAPGQSWMDTVPPSLAAQLGQMADAEGWLPPWPQWWGEETLAELIPDPEERQRFAAGCPRLPLAMFTEVQPPAEQWPDAPAAYLLLSEAYQDHADKARERGWPVTELASHHLAPLTDPVMVAESLRELIGQLQPKP
jgi:hypothetical protein